MNFSARIILSHNNKLISRLELRELPAGRTLLVSEDSEDGVTAQLRDLGQRHRPHLRHGILRLQEGGPDIQSYSEELAEHKVECGHEQGRRRLLVPVVHHLPGEQLLPGLRGPRLLCPSGEQAEGRPRHLGRLRDRPQYRPGLAVQQCSQGGAGQGDVEAGNQELLQVQSDRTRQQSSQQWGHPDLHLHQSQQLQFLGGPGGH